MITTGGCGQGVAPSGSAVRPSNLFTAATALIALCRGQTDDRWTDRKPPQADDQFHTTFITSCMA